MRRVVVTGMGGVSALGNDWDSIEAAFRTGTSAVRYMTEWDRYVDMGTRLAAPCDGFNVPETWTRKQIRGMGRVSRLAVRAAELTIANAGLAGSGLVSDGSTPGTKCQPCANSSCWTFAACQPSIPASRSARSACAGVRFEIAARRMPGTGVPSWSAIARPVAPEPTTPTRIGLRII